MPMVAMKVTADVAAAGAKPFFSEVLSELGQDALVGERCGDESDEC